MADPVRCARAVLVTTRHTSDCHEHRLLGEDNEVPGPDLVDEPEQLPGPVPHGVGTLVGIRGGHGRLDVVPRGGVGQIAEFPPAGDQYAFPQSGLFPFAVLPCTYHPGPHAAPPLKNMTRSSRPGSATVGQVGTARPGRGIFAPLRLPSGNVVLRQAR